MNATRFIGALMLAGLLVVGCGQDVDLEASRTFIAARGGMSVTIFPVALRHGDHVEYSTAEAVRLGAAMELERLAHPRISAAEVPLSTDWRRKPSSMWKRSAQEFQAYLRNHPVETDYALLAEYLLGTRVVGGVHVFAVDQNGQLAFGRMLNSKWTEFRDVSPQSAEECTIVVLNALRADLSRKDSTALRSHD